MDRRQDYFKIFVSAIITPIFVSTLKSTVMRWPVQQKMLKTFPFLVLIFISISVFLNGNPVPVAAILKSPELSGLLSDEGTIPKPYYPVNELSVETVSK